MKSFILIAIAIVIILVFTFKMPGRNTPQPAVDPENATYQIENTKFTLTGGVWQEHQLKSSTISVRMFGQPVYGDLNGDGINDAALMLQYQPGGSGTFYYVAAAINKDEHFTGVANSILLGDRIAPQNIEIKDGKILANYADRKPGEPMTAQPSLGVTKYIVLQGNVLVETQPVR